MDEKTEPLNYNGKLAETVQAGVSVITLIGVLVVYALGSVVWVYSTFATQSEIQLRAQYRATEMAEVKDKLKTIESKLDQILINQRANDH